MEQTQEEIGAETRQALNADQEAGGRPGRRRDREGRRARLDEAEQRRLIDEALADVDLSTLVPPEPGAGA